MDTIVVDLTTLERYLYSLSLSVAHTPHILSLSLFMLLHFGWRKFARTQIIVCSHLPSVRLITIQMTVLIKQLRSE
jgi:hypothetical protein